MLLLLSATLLSEAGRPSPNYMIKFGKEKESMSISRNSAVLVEAYRSEGSGTLFSLHDLVIMVSASHVTGSQGSKGIVIKDGESYHFEVFYSHRYADISFSVVKGHGSDGLVEYVAAEPSSIGERMVYSGYPDSFNNCSFQGTLVGGEMLQYNPRYVLNIYSWFGSSGAVAFNDKGEAVGVNSSIANLNNRHSSENVAMETLAFFSPLYDYSAKKVVSMACEYGVQSRKCR